MIRSFLTSSLRVWFGSLTAQDRKSLKRIVHLVCSSCWSAGSWTSLQPVPCPVPLALPGTPLILLLVSLSPFFLAAVFVLSNAPPLALQIVLNPHAVRGLNNSDVWLLAKLVWRIMHFNLHFMHFNIELVFLFFAVFLVTCTCTFCIPALADCPCTLCTLILTWYKLNPCVGRCLILLFCVPMVWTFILTCDSLHIVNKLTLDSWVFTHD